MTEDNNKRKERERNEKAKSILKVTQVKTEDGAEHSTGAEAFAKFFNSLVDEIETKAKKEADKPRYRFLDIINDENNVMYNNLESIFAAEGFIDSLEEIEGKLKEFGYTVEIIEDLECKDVTVDERYSIRIANTNNVILHLSLLQYQKNIKDFSFNEQDYIEEQIARIVGTSTNKTKKIAEYVVEYISHIMYFRQLYTLEYRKIGWDTYDWDLKGYIFKYDKIYSDLPSVSGRGKSKYKDGLEICSESPLMKMEWITTTIDLLNKHVYCGMILGAGISGLVRQLLPYTKETNINMNIVGQPASGKSTICHYLLGIFGNPEKLEGSFTDTTNSMEEIRVRRPILPYVLDERMLKLQNESEKSKVQTILTDIFREYEGKVKERLGKQYEEQSGERTYGPIISSSVDSIMEYLFEAQKRDLGQYRRFIEFNIGRRENKLLFSDEIEAEKIEKMAYKNYGIGVRLIVDYMLNMCKLLGDEINIFDLEEMINYRFETLNFEISEKLKLTEKKEELKGITASSKRFALIILSYKILRESLIYSLYSDVTDEGALASIYEELESDSKLLKELENIANGNVSISQIIEEIKEKIDKLEEESKKFLQNEDYTKCYRESKEKIDDIKKELKDQFKEEWVLDEVIVDTFSEREKEEKIKEKIQSNIMDSKSVEDVFASIKIIADIEKELYQKNEIFKVRKLESDIEELKEIKKKIEGKNKTALTDLMENIRNNIETLTTIISVSEKLITYATFKDLIEPKEDLFIEDKSWEILDLLIKNLVDKMRRIEKRPEEYTNAIYDYVMENKENFFIREKFRVDELQELNDCDCSKLGTCIIDEGKRKMIIYTLERYSLAQFFYKEVIPKTEELFAFIKEAENQKFTASQSLQYGVKNYNTVEIKGKDARNGKRSDKPIVGKTDTNKKERVAFYELEICYVDLKEGES